MLFGAAGVSSMGSCSVDSVQCTYIGLVEFGRGPSNSGCTSGQNLQSGIQEKADHFLALI